MKLSELTVRHCDLMSRHGNPIIRDHVAVIARQMAVRHEHDEYNAAMDRQAVNDILHYADAESVWKAISEMERIDAARNPHHLMGYYDAAISPSE